MGLKLLNLGTKKDQVRGTVEEIVPGSTWCMINRYKNSIVRVNYRDRVKVNYDTTTGSCSMLIEDFLATYRPAK